MPHPNRHLSSGESGKETWLGAGPRARRRRWALEEELFGPGSTFARQKELEALEADLAEEQAELVGLTVELQRLATRIAGLKQRLERMTVPGSVAPAPVSVGEGTRTDTACRTPPTPDYRLRRCEGFDVDSPTRRVGFVEGLRYLSRIDRPDVLEVRAGPFGRQLLLIPVEEVDQIMFDEGRLVLRSTPRLRHDFFQELLARRRARKRAREAIRPTTPGSARHR